MYGLTIHALASSKEGDILKKNNKQEVKNSNGAKGENYETGGKEETNVRKVKYKSVKRRGREPDRMQIATPNRAKKVKTLARHAMPCF